MINNQGVIVIAGAYFVTICAYNRMCLFGRIVKNESNLAYPRIQLNKIGKIVLKTWKEFPVHFPGVESRELSILPNHLHGIIWIRDHSNSAFSVGATHASPLHASGPRRHSLSSVIGSFKSASTKKINEIRGIPGQPVWQRNFYEHIIRDDESYVQIGEYILNNVLKWESDELFSER